VASLEQVCSGLRQAAPSPVFVPKQRLSRLDALYSLYASSAEGRLARVFSELPDDQKVNLSELFATTHIRRCYGWIRLEGEALVHLNERITAGGRRAGKGELVPTQFEAGRHYYGIVYEYLPAAQFDVNALQQQIDFFYYAGFKTCQGANIVNWQGPGIKLDFGDYRSPVDPMFDGTSYHAPPAPAWYILGMDDPEPEAQGLTEEQRDAKFEEDCRNMRRLVARSRTVETACCARYYARGRGPRHPPNGDGLPSDIFPAVRVPEIEPAAIRKAWKQYRRSKKQYLLKVASEIGAA
jgi:hypothetical protein